MNQVRPDHRRRGGRAVRRARTSRPLGPRSAERGVPRGPPQQAGARHAQPAAARAGARLRAQQGAADKPVRNEDRRRRSARRRAAGHRRRRRHRRRPARSRRRCHRPAAVVDVRVQRPARHEHQWTAASAGTDVALKLAAKDVGADLEHPDLPGERRLSSAAARSPAARSPSRSSSSIPGSTRPRHSIVFPNSFTAVTTADGHDPG